MLSEAFIVTFAFSPRYTVTFGKFPSAVTSVNVISRPSSPTSFTTGLTVSTTSTVIVFSSDCFPWLSVALYFTVYLPSSRVLIALVVELSLTEIISTDVPLPLVKFLSSSLSLALTRSFRLSDEPYSTTFLSPWKVAANVGFSLVTLIGSHLYGLP